MDNALLLVDDEEGIRKVLGITLADSGYTVHTAANGNEALEVWREHRPGIVLTDIKMPGMDGLELLQALKAEDPETEVIMITGHGDMDSAIESLRNDAADFITKPINDEVLEFSLRRVRERIRMRRQLQEYTQNLENLVREKSQRVVQLERQLAVGQVVEALGSAVAGLSREMDHGDPPVFNELPCFVAIHNRDQKVVATNALYAERFGDRSGKPSAEVYCGQAASPDECPVGRTLATGQPQRFQVTACSAEGRELPLMVHTAPVRNHDGDVDLVLEISVDVSEITRLRDELRFTRQRYQQLFDAAPCYISVQDMDLRIAETNDLFKQDFGDFSGEYCYQVYRHRSRPCDNCPAFETFESGEPFHTEEIVTSRTGERYNVLVWTAPIRDTSGEVVQVMELATNITQIRQLQDHLTSLGMLLGSVSHGVKGMLTALDGGIYRLESGMKKQDFERISSASQVIKKQVGKIQRMVLDILYYAKSREINWDVVSARELAEEILDTAGSRAEQAGVRLHSDIQEDLPKFEADPTAVSSAVVNFLENGVDACTTGRNADPQIHFSVESTKDHVVFSVEDNGPGMDQETQDKIFSLFFSTKGNKGTGLGLFIANQVIEQHGGRIEVSSELGNGTRFIIRLPRQLPSHIKNAPQPRSTS